MTYIKRRIAKMTKANVALLVTITREQRDYLRKIAAERTLANPEKVVTASGLVREIVRYHLKKGLPLEGGLTK
jgi:hypothetical protein